MNVCPKCGTSKCYVSLSCGVECSTPTCQNYAADLYPSESKKAEEAPKAEAQMEPVEQPDPNKVLFYWSHYHSDCGD